MNKTSPPAGVPGPCSDTAGSAGDPFAAFLNTEGLLSVCKAMQYTQAADDRERMFAAFSATYDADPADPSMVEDLAKFCDGWQAAMSADPPALRQAEASGTQPAATQLSSMLDRPEAPTVARMRAVFEKIVNDNPVMQQLADLRTVEFDGTLSRYEDPCTDLLWLSFVLSMRASRRVAADGAPA